jgi:hypothetical protein
MAAGRPHAFLIGNAKYRANPGLIHPGDIVRVK